MSTAEKPRRINVKELAKANRSLKRKVQKEHKRREDIERYQKENQALSYRLLELQDDRIPFVRSERNNTGEFGG